MFLHEEWGVGSREVLENKPLAQVRPLLPALLHLEPPFLMPPSGKLPTRERNDPQSTDER